MRYLIGRCAAVLPTRCKLAGPTPNHCVPCTVKTFCEMLVMLRMMRRLRKEKVTLFSRNTLGCSTPSASSSPRPSRTDMQMQSSTDSRLKDSKSFEEKECTSRISKPCGSTPHTPERSTSWIFWTSSPVALFTPSGLGGRMQLVIFGCSLVPQIHPRLDDLLPTLLEHCTASTGRRTLCMHLFARVLQNVSLLWCSAMASLLASQLVFRKHLRGSKRTLWQTTWLAWCWPRSRKRASRLRCRTSSL
mmetsp:Transcript_4631/g.8875  ORF Transcript_4631/g.8875 Transcript_4631/m.8875 type:complete len:246 (+) Transcript_4631:7971-8708(+)